MLREAPRARALDEELHRVRADLRRPVERLLDSRPSSGRRRARHYSTSRMSVRVRMAPSPTGFLHIGGVRTFLFNWLFARAARRRVPAADREHRHEPRGGRGDGADPALAAVARDRLGRRRSRSSSTRWNGAGSSPSASSPRATPTRTRARSASACPTRARPAGTTPSAAGSSSRTSSSRTSSSSAPTAAPTYNFASPVEDMDDGITHVIRGDDHVSNTPKQIHILARARRRAAACTRTCPTSSARTGRSSRSATARSRSTSSARRATSPRRS